MAERFEHAIHVVEGQRSLLGNGPDMISRR